MSTRVTSSLPRHDHDTDAVAINGPANTEEATVGGAP